MIEENKIIVFNSDKDILVTLPEKFSIFINHGGNFFIYNKGPGKITVIRSTGVLYLDNEEIEQVKSEDVQ